VCHFPEQFQTAPEARQPRMRIGIFADTHDHLAHIRLAVERFNREACECVLFAGDLVSPIAVRPLRALACPLIGCFGDNEGNKVGILSGMSLVSKLFADPPVAYQAADGTRFLIAHTKRQILAAEQPFDIAVYAHTHKPRIHRDEQQRLFLNPGETSGWSFGKPTLMLLETRDQSVELVTLA